MHKDHTKRSWYLFPKPKKEERPTLDISDASNIIDMINNYITNSATDVMKKQKGVIEALERRIELLENYIRRNSQP